MKHVEMSEGGRQQALNPDSVPFISKALLYSYSKQNINVILQETVNHLFPNV